MAQLCDYENVNKRMAAENGTLFTRLEELNGNAGMLQKIKVTLSSQLDDAKRACDEEAKERQSLLGRRVSVAGAGGGAKSPNFFRTSFKYRPLARGFL